MKRTIPTLLALGLSALFTLPGHRRQPRAHPREP
ncbi:hypothetical protein PKB_3020 [Pseudomonas knackmussii B13]|uniref:Uncharacterized protein n=1 Tax=Pseudomonas knackmussii (strain DSM 6978 / CCUG 54928 / LMG 23759 / B13) TaxID=1301098 RepID=A0A024HIN4_PSEKB|nr:hypothetical protein PKB_3020 [Pseudomonas knackmussii B13]